MINLDGAVVIVTGSASGTGAATALCLAGKGANVVVNYSRSKEKAEEVANSCSKLGAESKKYSHNTIFIHLQIYKKI